ncbi:hypothetical protein [Rhodovulum sp. 12E13]|uniref:hypothetical protein n=1 Tax=Rhodovulum sp. 12E13 TaxID=2203891 RepID=UPI0018F78662|nr:hypothetical protein [Rhodovulum sp. 12E13]
MILDTGGELVAADMAPEGVDILERGDESGVGLVGPLPMEGAAEGDRSTSALVSHMSVTASRHAVIWSAEAAGLYETRSGQGGAAHSTRA